MVSTTRAEREALLAQDDGAPEETVSTPSNSLIAHPRYHDDPECYQILKVAPENRRQWTREKAQIRGRIPCRLCVLGEEISHTPETEHGCRSNLEALIHQGKVPEDLLGSGWSA